MPRRPANPPIGGLVDGSNQVAVHDDVDRFVSLGPIGYTSCKGHIELNSGNKETWGRVREKKVPHSNNYVLCFTPTPKPTPLPTAAPTPKATFPVEDAAGDGCKYNEKFSSKFVASSGNSCKVCSLCEGSHLSAIFDPSSQGICIGCTGIEDSCEQFVVMTTFDNEMRIKKCNSSPTYCRRWSLPRIDRTYPQSPRIQCRCLDYQDRRLRSGAIEGKEPMMEMEIWIGYNWDQEQNEGCSDFQ